MQRRLTTDQVEQSWYWIDLANSLRAINREQSLPHLLRCAENAGDVPLGHFFAAETVCFLSFPGYLRQASSPLGRAALRVLHRALEGLRFGVQPQVLAEGRLGEAIESLWDYRPDNVDPLVVRVFVEAIRQVHRAPHIQALLSEESSESEAYQWQVSRLTALESVLSHYVSEVPVFLSNSIVKLAGEEQRDALLALHDLRAESANGLLPLLGDDRLHHPALAADVLTWSKAPETGPRLRQWAAKHVAMDRRAMKRRQASSPGHRSMPSEMPYRSILRALRGHPSVETESFLMLAARDWDPYFRCAAVSSLGWWEPMDRPSVLQCLQETRRDLNPEVRQTARAALARLGERQALHWFRQALHAEEIHAVHEAIQVIATEGITLLWPDLDRLADSEERDLAFHAREVLERISEDLHR